MLEQEKKCAWNYTPVRIVVYAHSKIENTTSGSCNQLEYLLVSQILSICLKNKFDIGTDWDGYNVLGTYVELSEILDFLYFCAQKHMLKSSISNSSRLAILTICLSTLFILLRNMWRFASLSQIPNHNFLSRLKLSHTECLS